MPRPCFRRPALILASLLFLAAGCGQQKTASQTPAPAEPPQQAASVAQTSLPIQEPPAEPSGSCPDPRAVQTSEHNRASCFHLQPAPTVTEVVKQKSATKKGPVATSKTPAKKGTKATAKTSGAQETKVIQTTGLCQPQSLIYARCRTGIMTCRLGNTSPVQWFACARQHGATTGTPVAGSVLLLDVNVRRGMPTGHPAYVEEVKKNGSGTYTLRLSHTNYDRKCHLDQDATVIYDPKRMTVSFESGPWAAWAKDLKALGFILR
jgi:hypothetical protein